MIYVMSEYKTGSDEVNAQCDAIRDIIKKYDDTAMLIGEAPCTEDLITHHEYRLLNTVNAVFHYSDLHYHRICTEVSFITGHPCYGH